MPPLEKVSFLSDYIDLMNYLLRQWLHRRGPIQQFQSVERRSPLFVTVERIFEFEPLLLGAMSTLATNHWWVSCITFAISPFVEQVATCNPLSCTSDYQNLKIQLYMVQSDDLLYYTYR